jgi:transcriptional regulator with XRE-family HTH domain
MSPIEFGAQIRAHRLEQHLEIAELAKLVGVTRQHLTDMEAGSFFDGDAATIAAIDIELDHPPHDCLMFEGIETWLPGDAAIRPLETAQQRRERVREFVDFVDSFLSRDQTCHTTFQC